MPALPDIGNDPLAVWQDLLPPGEPVGAISAHTFIARLPDGRRLVQPIRALPGPGQLGVASLIVNQASFQVEEALTDGLAHRLADRGIERIVAVPTLGLIAGRGVARALGHDRYVPLGTSRKFWYADDLSVEIRSITSPGQAKRLYLDPRLVPLIEGRRVALVDDVISSGSSILSALDLLARVDVEVTAIGVLMAQSEAWRPRLAERHPGFEDRVVSVFETPLLRRAGDGWEIATADTEGS